MYSYWVEIIIDFFELILFFIGLYYVVIGVFSFLKKAEIHDKDYKTNRFAIIIPAHNEALVLGQLLKSISHQNYSKDKTDVYVVADNCTDMTCQIAKNYKANVVEKNGEGGKSSAVELGIKAVISSEKKYDCIAVFDADNVLDKNCIAEVNDMMNLGYSVVQSRVESRNPNENWLTSAYAVWHILENRLSKMATHNLGIGCKIAGTGFALKIGVLDVCPWDCLSMAEDLEYTVKLNISGIKVGYANNAVVYDEKPACFRKSVMQRIRWTQGIVDVQGQYGWWLLRKGKFVQWLSLYGDFLGQFTFGIFLLISIFSTASIVFDLDFVLCSLWVHPICYVVLNLYLGIGIFSAFAGLVIDKKLNRRVILNLFGFMIYMLSWIPISIVGAFKHNKKEWYHTEHTG